MSDFAFKSLGPALHVLALVILFALVAAGVALAVYLAGLPGRIAARRGNPQASAINICGWLGHPRESCGLLPWYGPFCGPLPMQCRLMRQVPFPLQGW
ncbi:DUF3302 domain-containing protein [Bythopirellula polymerisocia]|uniref:Uncharacterized protein n=1 Tax=Bythopirellula polymerisocia TaxID=2528003 RepID=A0A5C6CRI7_9BACT|nr:DUF3302 domain-containing protein [Bythopirellula polymerisocia]TWU26061.1 hypothetical protein Pla144_32780 [Bythopirellula polymerisocia]